MTEPRPYFRTFIPPRGSNLTSAEQERDEHRAAVAAASREASQREADFMRALGRSRTAQSELPPIKEPVLPQDFAQRIAALDEAIYRKGIGVNKDELFELGRERFVQLIELGRLCRQPRDVRTSME